MEKELLQRYVEGSVSEPEVEEVMSWLGDDERNIRELNALHRLYGISLFNKPALERVGRPKKRFGIGRLAVELLKLAAVFAIAYGSFRFISAGADGQAVDEAAAEWQTLLVPSGQRAELILSDGTEIWVNAHSRILYPYRFERDRREVMLDGEAYFNVKHIDGRPFTVKTKTADIEVKGTEFNVMADSAKTLFAVSLLKGSIELTLAGNRQSYLMKPNEHVELQDGKLLVSEIRDFEYFRWKEGLLCFNNETVGAIIEKLQLYYDVKIDVRRRNLLGYRYSGKFRTKDGVEQVLKVLQLEHHFAYTKDNEQNLITIK